PEGTLVAAVRRAGVVPSADTLGPLAERVLEAWAADHESAPGIRAVWARRAEGSEISASFLLDVDGDARLPAGGGVAGITVSFERRGSAVRATAVGPELPCLRRGIWAFADGLLTPVGSREEGALHLPLLAAPLAISGHGAAAQAEAMILAAALRSRPEELRVVVVGEVGVLGSGLPSGGDDLPDVRYVATGEADGLRRELEAQL